MGKPTTYNSLLDYESPSKTFIPIRNGRLKKWIAITSIFLIVGSNLDKGCFPQDQQQQQNPIIPDWEEEMLEDLLPLRG